MSKSESAKTNNITLPIEDIRVGVYICQLWG